MPYAIEGLEQTLKALRKFSPELYKEMNNEIKPELKSMVIKAKDKLVDGIAGLSNFGVYNNKSGKTPVRTFPIYNASDARKGIAYSIGAQKRNSKGWTNRYLLWNRTRAGAIVEWSGRVNPSGKSDDRRSQHFVRSVNQVGQLKQVGKKTGRIIYAALEENQGRAKRAIEQAVEKACAKFNAGNLQ